MSSFNPFYKLQKQLNWITNNQEDIEAKLASVKLPFDKTFLNKYPHQLSGGQLQRLSIAAAFLKKVKLIVADEITTALDPKNAENINELLRIESAKHNTAVIYISHDLTLVESFCDKTIVLKQGKEQERNDTKLLFHSPKSAYTKALLQSHPKLANSLYYLPTLLQIENEESLKKRNKTISNENTLSCDNLDFAYPNSAPLFKDFSFELKKGETLGLQGNSGSGKSTLAKCLVGWHKAQAGFLTIANKKWTLGEKQPENWHELIQYVFQDPNSALNPRLKIRTQLQDALPKNSQWTCEDIMAMVELEQEHLNKYPHQMSGGQKQRVNIARAIAKQPKVIVLDESVAALDLSVQAGVLNTLNQLQEKMGISYLFVSHDPDVVNYFCDRKIVLDA